MWGGMPSCRRCLRGFPIHGLLRKAAAGRRGRRPLQRGHPPLAFFPVPMYNSYRAAFPAR